MKKIIISIAVIAAMTIAIFIFLIQPNIDRNLILYKSLITYEDITYKTADGQRLTLDILMPTEYKHDTTPVIFYVHGGSFTEGEKSWLTLDIGEQVTQAILDAGYAIITMDYRYLDEDTHFPSNLIDIKDSIRYINSVAEDYNLDTSNFGIFGSNAGAYLALTVGYSPSALFLGDYDLRSYSAEVNYVVDLYGMTKMSEIKDITSMTADELATTQIELDHFFGEGLDIYNLTETDYETLGAYDPMMYVSIDTIPTLIIHGVLDEVVDIHQSELLETKLLEYSIEYQFYKILGGNNGLTSITDNEKANVCSYVVSFMNNHYVAS